MVGEVVEIDFFFTMKSFIIKFNKTSFQDYCTYVGILFFKLTILMKDIRINLMLLRDFFKYNS